jgi:hypothetical protein
MGNEIEDKRTIHMLVVGIVRIYDTCDLYLSDVVHKCVRNCVVHIILYLIHNYVEGGFILFCVVNHLRFNSNLF